MCSLRIPTIYCVRNRLRQPTFYYYPVSITSSKTVASPCRARTLSMELDFGVALTVIDHLQSIPQAAARSGGVGARVVLGIVVIPSPRCCRLRVPAPVSSWSCPVPPVVVLSSSFYPTWFVIEHPRPTLRAGAHSSVAGTGPASLSCHHSQQF